jgi:hypothetical protein
MGQASSKDSRNRTEDGVNQIVYPMDESGPLAGGEVGGCFNPRRPGAVV